MKTILKHTVYLAIESENCDRKLLSQTVRNVVFPEIDDTLKRSYIKFHGLAKISKACLIPEPKMQILSERELFKPDVKENFDHLKDWTKL